MSTTEAQVGRSMQTRDFFANTVPRIAFRLIGLAIVDTFALYFFYLLVADQNWPLALTVAAITIAINVIFLREDLYPVRWMAPGLTLLTLMVIFPVLFTVYTAFTNYSDGHLLTKQQTINLLTERGERILPEGATAFSWTAFRSPDGEFALWLQSPQGETLLAKPGEPVQDVKPGEAGVGPLNDDGIPISVDGYEQLDRRDTIRYLSELGKLEFGEAPDTVKINSLSEAARYEPRYVYEPEQDAIIDQKTGTPYFGNQEQGVFMAEDSSTLRPGYRINVGLSNFQRIVASPALRGPILRVILWTFGFAFLSVLTTFALGLFLAIVYNDETIPGRKFVRSLLIVPYAVPAVISVLIWRGMLNPYLGVISTNMQDLIGWAPPWFSDPWWAKVAIVLINLWLGYPYMMLICSGALQSIPTDLYEAAQVDGANRWQQFWEITLPLLLVSTAPLLIASFAFNFNNFNVIYLFNEGGPPISGAPTPAGHTDILITYTFRLAFGGGRGADYGFAAAITIIIFAIVAAVTLIQFRYTRILEEVSENV